MTTDTNTTYSAGTNISLDGTTFNVDDVFLKNDADDATTGVLHGRWFSQLQGHALDSVGLSMQFKPQLNLLPDNDTNLMTSAAIQDKIQSYGYVTTDTDTTYSAGTNISLDGTTFNVDDAFT